MKALVIPPHGDLTLTINAQVGWTVVDCERAFIERILRPGYIEDTIYHTELRHDLKPQDLNRLLLLKAASVLLRRSTDLHTRLRAIGTALTALSGPPGTITLTLDDLEIVDGSTERSLDILQAIEGEYLFAPEIESAVKELSRADCVRLVIDRDQHLSGALAIARHLNSGISLELCGQFAYEHRRALLRLPAFAHARVEGAAALRWRVMKDDDQKSELLWHTTANSFPPENGSPWTGYVPLQALADYNTLIASGCQTAVVGFSHLTDSTVIGIDGTATPRKTLEEAIEHLRAASVHVVAEWSIGAPGTTEQVLLETSNELSSAPFFDWLAGLRLFLWPINQSAQMWAGTSVTISKPEDDRDLARSRPFAASGTITSDWRSILESLTTRISRRMVLSPGRVAGAYLHMPRLQESGGQFIALDPDCAIVDMPTAVDGRPDKTTYAVNLRTRTVIAVDGRLAGPLSTLWYPTSPATALAAVPNDQRARICHTLIAKSILKEVGA